MKLTSEFIWAALLIVTAALFFYLGIKTGSLETEEALNDSIEKKAKEISALERKIHQLSEELTSRGIFSYPQASVISEKTDSAVTVLIHLNGREAIPNLEIERKIMIDDSIPKDGKAKDLSSGGTKTSIGDLHAHNPVAFKVDDFQNQLGIDLFFRSERKQWHQYIRARRTLEGEIKTFWIITNQESEVIDKHMDEGFPVNSTGSISFDANKNIKYSEVRMNSIFRPYASE